jgi:hypothetical protein
MTIQPGDAAAWAGVAVALTTGIVALVLSGLSRRDSKEAVREASRAADAAERSAQADQEAHRIEQLRHHQERQPRFQAGLGMTGTHADIPEVVLEYLMGRRRSDFRVRVASESAGG